MIRRDLIGAMAIAATALARPARSQAPSSTVRIAERFASALTAHDIDALAALFADDYVNHQASAAAPSPPPGVTFKQRTVAFFADRLKGLPDLKVAIEAIVADGDKVAASFVYEGTHQGVYLGVAPTGKRLRFTSCDIFRVKDGHIAEHWGMGDAAGILAQLKG
ncbi:MAG: ester cyclase [Methylocystis sp.]|nr:ester cyclase [Methylocystis sp.]MBI3274924.1 ester cyclase [Methylocystis sp.]